jgi:hypothetical protein
MAVRPTSVCDLQRDIAQSDENTPVSPPRVEEEIFWLTFVSNYGGVRSKQTRPRESSYNLTALGFVPVFLQDSLYRSPAGLY